MRGLIQRVEQASVTVAGENVGAIGHGLLLFLGVEPSDDASRLDKLLHKIVNYRIFADEAGKMNRSLKDIGGGILVVSQFTLVADTGRGLRPSFSGAASPDHAEALYNLCIERLRAQANLHVASGRFGADMQVALVNDGPVTFLLGV